jgi:hypothetical protein
VKKEISGQLSFDSREFSLEVQQFSQLMKIELSFGLSFSFSFGN